MSQWTIYNFEQLKEIKTYAKCEKKYDQITWISFRIAEKSVKRPPGMWRKSPHSTISARSSGLREVCTSGSTTGRRVHMSEPLAKKSRPTSASKTRDFPLLWLPTTATCKLQLPWDEWVWNTKKIYYERAAQLLTMYTHTHISRERELHSVRLLNC